MYLAIVIAIAVTHHAHVIAIVIMRGMVPLGTGAVHAIVDMARIAMIVIADMGEIGETMGTVEMTEEVASEDRLHPTDETGDNYSFCQCSVEFISSCRVF
ncbi:hypothetical protein OESDEN_21153 [Oesophagostomum dentatum]|uniref:Uncharacterized protein n=1 Tax=Oesophagostomum dentatum TaxID=61180 RepID=A0A0B1S6U2_OESDE|nr:hypothetical protein OESDEN_21153 [Oesophagostomum dentatum]